MKIGLIGSNIQQSLSPKLWRYFGAIAGVDIEFVPIEIKEDGVVFMHKVVEFFRTGGDALCVTAPFKEYAYMFCDKTATELKEIRAANLITMNEIGKLYGTNTDIGAFYQSFEYGHMPKAYEKILILGSGDMSRAIAATCGLLTPTTVHIASRNPVGDTGRDYKDLDNWYDLVIDTTSCANCVLPDNVNFHYGYDLQYKRESTVLKDRALSRYMDGKLMVILQAIESFNSLNLAPPITLEDHPYLRNI